MPSSDKSRLSYAEAGVDIEAGNALVERIKPAANATRRNGVMGGLGGFGGLFDLAATGYRDPILVAATDGVGTKLMLAIERNDHRTIGIDLVAMCVNDIVVQGADPLFFLDYYATGKLDANAAGEVIEGVAQGCTLAGAALLGGETAEMPGMYPSGHYDLAGFCVGVAERDKLITGDTVCAGDILLGLKSDGFHSNGYSLVRKVLERTGTALDDNFGEIDFGTALLKPTRIYVRPLLEVQQQHRLAALAHITGGGLTENIPRVIPNDCHAEIDLNTWALPEIFDWLASSGDIAEDEMLRTFNCGIGMVVVAKPESATKVAQQLNTLGETVTAIGEIAAGAGPVRYSGRLA